MAFIDKEKLLHEISLNGSTWAKDYHFSWSHGLEAKNRMVKLIEEQPTVDAELVRHGRWIERTEPISWCEDDVDVFYECSLCKCVEPGKSNYCPDCGAKMDAEVK